MEIKTVCYHSKNSKLKNYKKNLILIEDMYKKVRLLPLIKNNHHH